MKNKIILIVSVIILIVVICLLIKPNSEVKETNINNERYNEIKTSVRKGVDWMISARYPSCENAGEFDESLKTDVGSHSNSSFLINNGYIKKDDLLDVDNKSYCDVYVVIKSLYENPYDHQNNCKIYSKIYLKCKDYEDKGYFNWEKDE